MNVGLLNYAYKNLLKLDPAVASKAADVMICAFCVPLWIIGTTFLSVGNAFTFGGLLVTLPSQERFDEFKRSLSIGEYRL